VNTGPILQGLAQSFKKQVITRRAKEKWMDPLI
jgi:hypothetical protein